MCYALHMLHVRATHIMYVPAPFGPQLQLHQLLNAGYLLCNAPILILNTADLSSIAIFYCSRQIRECFDGVFLIFPSEVACS